MDASQDRREFKFLLSGEVLNAIRHDVAEQLDVDANAVDGYRIRSDYFDSQDRMSYWQKIFGQQNRRRVRTRTYGETNQERPPTRFIEIKHKQDGLTVKRRLEAEAADLDRIVRGEVPQFEDDQGKRFHSELCSLIKKPRWNPVVRIQYHRWAYDSGVDGTIRITFDTDICCCFPDYESGDDPDPDLDLLPDGGAIMEVKTIGAVPYWFRCLLGKYSLVPRGFSKYTVALERYEFSSPGR